MLKRMSIKKITLATLSLFVLFLIYIIPGNDELNKLDIPTKIEYNEGTIGVIYLIDKDEQEYSLGKYLSALGLHQARIGEEDKFTNLTY